MASELSRFLIVGIGASAGGIPAMEEFFGGLPDDCGMAFVVVPHLSPERESLLHEVVGRYTQMPVKVADDDMRVEVGQVYVMPQNAILTIEKGMLRMRRPDALHRERKPVDIFFSELARDRGERAVGIILSGGDSDGTLGVKAIKEHGGLTIAQAADGSGPRNPGMPQSAISSGLIDIAVPAAEMGERLIAFTRNFEMVRDLSESGSRADALDQAQDEIYAILRKHSGHDFSGYKSKTFVRRIRRRMQLGQKQSVAAYIEWLRTDPAEVTGLFRDLLINVTNFFRDADAFRLLEQKVIPKLFAGKSANDSVRVWVPGCATGEEVFSLGILMREHMETLAVVPRVQIFATDIDEPALAVARAAARYPEALLDGLSAERRQRFFDIDAASYVLSKSVRELCIFSPHSVFRDPPLSRMDLISCRNLLIYFGRGIQNKVIPIFHYSLKPGGYLFLGTAEGISQQSELFATVDRKHRIFQAREHAGRTPRLPIPARDAHPKGFLASATRESREISAYPLRRAIEAQVLERFAPAHVVVNGDGEVLYFSAGTGKYLEAARGSPSRQLLGMVRRGLRLDLGGALREAIATRRAVVRENVAVDQDDDRVQFVSLAVEPLADRGIGELLYVVLFDPSGPSQVRSGVPAKDRDPAILDDVERELRDLRERLQSTIEQYETAIEEVTSANEELLSVNEEAQSSNEELEASKEEMQSLNEELNTINTELSGKIEELDRANSDLRNLFESTGIATVFLDRGLVIRSYTPAASTFFNLRPADIGRPLTDLTSRLDYPELKDHIDGVFATGEALDHHLARDAQGKSYLVRLSPYREDSSVQGVVVTLVDVTRLVEAEERQQELISELNHRVRNMLAVVISIANHTMKSTSSKEAFHQTLIGRLHAMARAHSLLSQDHWTEASIRKVIEPELEAFGADRFALRGPDVRLTPQAGLSLGMVVHELATNAIKHGALSTPNGKVEVHWAAADQRLTIEWRERGGPRIKEPTGTGFGLSLLKAEIRHRLGGNVETYFDPQGLSVTMSFPLHQQAPS